MSWPFNNVDANDTFYTEINNSDSILFNQYIE